MLRVLSGGIQTVVEDWQGRIVSLGNEMSPAGAMDDFAIRAGNLIVDNPINEAGLEIPVGHFSAEFETDTVIAITGANFGPKLNEKPIPRWEAVRVHKGDTFSSGAMSGDTLGFREYLAIAGGIDIPLYLESKATSIVVGCGGYEGRALRKGDTLNLLEARRDLDDITGRYLKPSLIPGYSRVWTLRAVPGPNAAPDYFSEEGMETFFTGEFAVQPMSDRGGIRLNEIKPGWAKERIERGGHPSNVDLDHGYVTPGALSMTGDTPIIYPREAPYRGGFVCALSIIYADQWMLGQIVPGSDAIKFSYCTLNEARKARKEIENVFIEESIISRGTSIR